ncbi:tRNA threonylcarbamoyladenosine biosynthesis protein TsaB [Anaerovirgula multivorans]|uniref:tRNA threonylcarbamoyladenosine biosynthesis protein TsaB n=1 Tax=Anaerovirgula multivorans TaxID=312168 RepID=A0A239EUM3_9FIRM|nr:tRNA (adenosine(37)-N6)-threonylcarbamoyltransferase complex dimerization subunit type 1 TsaB [Anaerovirgula multivorans]SNS47544.1 tRNA threonylcarbamoyladenosine biosynthesis protein TsaB [Anaerovirgula multivorans]
MKILALDTSSIVATAAVMDDEKLMGEYILNHKKTHSQKLMPILEEILESCELSPKEIDLFGVALGPGSFTGLRIGLATIKAMAQALDKPVVGVSTLEGLAFNLVYCKALICPIIDAQRNLVYTGTYQWQQMQLQKVMEEEVVPIEELIATLKDRSQEIVFVGDALEKFQGLIQEEMKGLAMFPPSIVRMPRASSIGELARRKAERGEVYKASEILPIYMRKSQAEKQWEERMKDGS